MTGNKSVAYIVARLAPVRGSHNLIGCCVSLLPEATRLLWGCQSTHLTSAPWPETASINRQESLANANVSARQQCMYEGRYRRNLSSVKNPTVEASIMSLSCEQPMLFYPVTTPGYLVGLYEIFLVLNRCPCNRKKIWFTTESEKYTTAE